MAPCKHASTHFTDLADHRWILRPNETDQVVTESLERVLYPGRRGFGRRGKMVGYKDQSIKITILLTIWAN